MKDYPTRRLGGAPADIARAAALLRQGELVAMPTETVYGLAADALNAAAVGRIFAAKGRPQDNPLIVHIAAADELPALVAAVPETARALAEAYWPGPLTMIFSRAAAVPAVVSAGLPSVAVRMPSHPIARELIRATGRPLAAPSANRSGSPSPTSAAHVLADLDGRIAAVIDGGPCAVGVESTVVDLTGDTPRLLRPGGVTVAMLEAVIGPVAVDAAVTHALAPGAAAPSPGMKYKHYAPRAHVTLVKGTAAAFTAYVNARAAEDGAAGLMAMVFDGEEAGLAVPCLTYGSRSDEAEQARRVFEKLRTLDDQGARRVYVSCPRPADIGLAVYNRLLRAAAFEVIDVD